MNNVDKKKNVFISHYHKDEEHIQKFKDLLGAKGYQIKNSSIDSTKPNQATNDDYIRRLLRLRIHWAGTFICLVGYETSNREWVDWEIEQAHKKGKRIIGVFVNGAKQDAEVPDNLNLYGHSLVGWDSNKIIGAIEGEHNDWCKPDGTLRDGSPYNPPRSDC